VAPPGNQAATENTNFNLYHSENPVYSPEDREAKEFLKADCGSRNSENRDEQ
jgi:hypothetical protein